MESRLEPKRCLHVCVVMNVGNNVCVCRLTFLYTVVITLLLYCITEPTKYSMHTRDIFNYVLNEFFMRFR